MLDKLISLFYKENKYDAKHGMYAIKMANGNFVYGSLDSYEENARNKCSAQWWYKNPDAKVVKVRFELIEEDVKDQ